MSGRTYWLMKDSAWWHREWIVDLGEEFGSAGPACVDWLECHAKAQNAGGHVKTGFKALARGVFSDVVTVRNVVSRAVTLRLLVEYEEENGIFKCVISWWKADQTKGLAADRQARKRGRLNEEVTLERDEALLVTRREEVKERANALSSARRSEVEKATDEDRSACRLFYELGRRRNPKMKVPTQGSSQQSAALKSMRLLREQDKQPSDDIQRLIRWLFTDDHEDAVFWGTTIQAPSGLRTNFSKVWSKMAAAELLGRDGQPHVETADERVARFEAKQRARAAA